MLTVCTSSTDVDYATTGDAMALLYGSTTTAAVGSTQEIDQVSRLVRRASAWAERYTGRTFGLQTYQETLPAYQTRHLVVSQTPIHAVLRLFDATSTDDATELDSTDYRIEDAEAGLLSRDRGFTWTVPERVTEGPLNLGLTGYRQAGTELRPWLIEYRAGYIPLGGLATDSSQYSTGALTGTSTASTLPDDLVQAVATRALELQSNPLGVSMRSVGDLRVQYASAGPGAGLSVAESLLMPYQRL